MKRAADGPLKGILEYCDEPLVSVDFLGNPHSSILDAQSTKVMGGDFAKVLAWYDNEWGYSCRVVDLAAADGDAMTRDGDPDPRRAARRGRARASACSCAPT